MAIKDSRWKLYLISAVSAAVAGSATVLVYPQVVAALSGTYALTGKVSCVNSLVEGIWVEADSSGKGFANSEGVDVAEGWGWLRYPKPDMPKGASYSLHVGCGRKLLSRHWN